jgi:hypothetical protein
MSATQAPTEEAPTECPICIGTYTKVLRRAIECPSCQNHACKQCSQRYLTETAEDAHCMHCKARWGRRFLLTTFDKTWIEGDYRKHRAELLWRREESFLPATMPRVEIIVKGRRMEKEVLNPMKESIKAKEKEVEERILALDKTYINIERELKELKDTLASANREIGYYLNGETPPTWIMRERYPDAPEYARRATPAPAPAPKKVEFHRKCMKTNCNGWLSTAWRCGVCENYTCPTCYADKGPHRDADHECKEEDKATVALLARDTKPCPNCGMGVQRTEGCPVMFCTSCHKGFNWNTLKIMETGIHNPHYFEWRNRNPHAPEREMGDIPCGGLPEQSYFNTMASTIPVRTTLNNLYRIVQHVNDDWFMRQYRAGIEALDLRTKFLLGDTTKASVQTTLATREKVNELKIALWDCYSTLSVAGSELLRRFAEEIQRIMHLPGRGSRRQKTTPVRGYGYIRTAYWDEHPILAEEFPEGFLDNYAREAEELRMFINTSLLGVAEVYRSAKQCNLIRENWQNIMDIHTLLQLSAGPTDANTVTQFSGGIFEGTDYMWHKGDVVKADTKLPTRAPRKKVTSGGGAGSETTL